MTSKKAIRESYDARTTELVNTLGSIEERMKSTTTTAGLRKLHEEVKDVQREIAFSIELIVDLK